MGLKSFVRGETEIINIFLAQASPKIPIYFDAGFCYKMKPSRKICIDFENAI
jgi:hypothetical protein